MRSGRLDANPADIGVLANQIGVEVEDQRQSFKQFLNCTDNLRAGFGGPPADLNDEGALYCYSNANQTVAQRGDEQEAAARQTHGAYDSTISYDSSAMSAVLNV